MRTAVVEGRCAPTARDPIGAPAWAFVVPLLVIACSVDARGGSFAGASSPAPDGRTAGQRRGEALASLERELERASESDRRAAATAVGEVTAFIESRKDAAPRFAEEILSLTSKLRYLIESRSTYQVHVGLVFDREVLGRDELEGEIERAIAVYQQELDAADARLLVALEPDLPQEFAAQVPQVLMLAGRSGVHTDEVIDHVQTAVGLEVGAELTATLATRVVGSLAARSGSETLARVALAGAGLSFGATLGIAVLVEVVFAWFDDSEEQIAADTRAGLDELEHRVVAGSAGEPGLLAVLDAMARDRQAARREALARAIGGEP